MDLNEKFLNEYKSLEETCRNNNGEKSGKILGLVI